MSLAEQRATLMAKLEAEGFAVTDDPRNVTPPCILVGLPSTITAVGYCAIEASIPVTVIATAPGNADAAVWLLDTVETLLGLLDADRADIGTTAVTGGKQRHPSYTLAVPVSF